MTDFDIEALRKRAVAAMGRRLSVSFVPHTNRWRESCFVGDDGKRLVAIPSKKYSRPDENYWYTVRLRQQKFLASSADSHMVLACEGLPNAYAIGYREFTQWASIAEPTEQHIYLEQKEARWYMHFGEVDSQRIPLDEYELPLGNGSPVFEKPRKSATQLEVAEPAVKPLTPSPKPPTERGGYVVERDPSHPAQTYLLRFGKSNVWKVGWAHDAAKRCADINTHIPDELLVRVLKVPFWKVHTKQDWANAALAHQMEQDVL